MKTYWVVVENAQGEDTEAKVIRMTGEEIQKKYMGKGSFQSEIAIFYGDLVKDFGSRMDLTKL